MNEKEVKTHALRCTLSTGIKLNMSRKATFTDASSRLEFHRDDVFLALRQAGTVKTNAAETSDLPLRRCPSPFIP